MLQVGCIDLQIIVEGRFASIL